MPSPEDWPADDAVGPTARRFLIAVGTAKYDHADYLRSIPVDLSRIVTLFQGRFGYQRVLEDSSRDPALDPFKRAMSSWLHDPDRRADDVVVFYYSGHGAPGPKGLYLLLRDSDPEQLGATALAAEDIADLLGELSPVQRLLVMLDTCYAGQGGMDLTAFAQRLAPLRPVDATELWCLGASRPREEAGQGLFSEALLAVIDEQRTGRSQQYLSMESLVWAINRWFKQKPTGQQATFSVAVSTGLAPFIPNPYYDPQRSFGIDLEQQQLLDRRDYVTHWGPRARGVEIERQPGWYFSGRTKLLQDLVRWLSNPFASQSLRVVTGGPGSGKSAVLARLVTASDPAARRAMEDAGALAGAPPGGLPPVGRIDVAIHAKSKTWSDVLSALVRATGISASTPEEFAVALTTRPDWLVIIIDALDEAVAPHEHIEKLVLPIAQRAGASSVRLLIGVRSHLVPPLRKAGAVRNLDEQPWLGPGDLTEYITRMLLAESEQDVPTPYRGHRQQARTVAQAVATRAHPTFLIARIVAHTLISADEMVDTTRPDWQISFPETVGAAFDRDLARLDPAELDTRPGPNERRARDLLTALAWAEGAGLPWEHLWAPVASAIANRPYTNADLDWLAGVAGAYVIEQQDSKRGVFRLYHEALAEHLRDKPREAEVQQRITHALIAHTPQGHDGQPDWFAALPYIRTYLAVHAAAAGQLDSFLKDPRFLLAASAEHLLRVLPSITDPDARGAAEVYQRTVHRLRPGAISVGAANLQLAARHQGLEWLADRVTDLELGQPWMTLWAHSPPAGPYRIVGHHGDIAANELAVGLGILDGEVIAVSGGWDGTLRIWDLHALQPRGEPLTPNHRRNRVDSVAVGESDGRPIAVSGGTDRTVRVWDLRTRQQIHRLRGHKGRIFGVTAVALGTVDGDPVIISGGTDGSIRIWDLRTGKCRWKFLSSPWQWLLTRLRSRRDGLYNGAVRTVMVSKLEGRPIAVSASEDNTVRVWDLRSRRLRGEPLPPSGSILDKTVIGELDGQPIAVLCRYSDDTIRVWDLGTGRPRGETLRRSHGGIETGTVSRMNGRPVAVFGLILGQLLLWDLTRGEPIGSLRPSIEGESAGGIASVAVGELDGHPIAVSGGQDGVIRMWDLERAQEMDDHDVQGAYEASVIVVAVGDLDGRPIAVSGGYGGIAQVWDPTSGQPIGMPLLHDAPVSALAVGEVAGLPVLVTGSWDGSIRVWDLRSGELRGEPLHGHKPATQGVTAVAVGTLNNQPIAVSGGDDGTLRVWDLTGHQPLGEPLRAKSPVTAVAVAEVDGHTIAVSGGDYRDSNLRLWDLHAGQLRGKPLRGERSGIKSVAIAEVRGDPVAISLESRTVRVWHLRTGELRGQLAHGTIFVSTAVAGELNGHSIAVSVTDDGTVRLWNLEQNSLIGTIEATGASRSMALGRDSILVLGGGRSLLALKLQTISPW